MFQFFKFVQAAKVVFVLFKKKFFVSFVALWLIIFMLR